MVYKKRGPSTKYPFGEARVITPPSSAPNLVLQALQVIQLAGEHVGVWHWDVELCDVYQDTGATLRATLTGDPVARIDDYFGHGYNLLQGTAGLQGTLLKTGARTDVRMLSKRYQATFSTALEIGQTRSGGYAILSFQDNTSMATTTSQNYFSGYDVSASAGRFRIQRQGAGRLYSQSLVSTNYNLFVDSYLVQSQRFVVGLRNKTNLPSRGVVYYENGTTVLNNQGSSIGGDYDIDRVNVGARDDGTEPVLDWQFNSLTVIDRHTVSEANYQLLEQALYAQRRS